MARTVLTVQKLNTAGGVAVTFSTADVVNGMQVPNDGKTVLLVSTPAGGGIGVSIPSKACSHNRLGDLFGSVAAGVTAQEFGPFTDPTIWGDGANLLINFLNNTGTGNLIAAVEV